MTLNKPGKFEPINSIFWRKKSNQALSSQVVGVKMRIQNLNLRLSIPISKLGGQD